MLNEDTKQACKGVSKHYQKQKLKHQHYVKALRERKILSATSYRIKTDKNKLFTIRETKSCLNPFNDKRYFVNEHESYAFGHFKIKKL